MPLGHFVADRENIQKNTAFSIIVTLLLFRFMNMNSEVESELNQILMAAIQSDIAQKAVEPAAPPTEKVDEIPRCSICCSQKPRYRCPACNMRTCSMECVKQHKIEENCSGKRDPTKKVDKKEMGDRMLLSGNFGF